MAADRNPFESLIPKKEEEAHPFGHLIPKEGKWSHAGKTLLEDVKKIPGAVTDFAIGAINAAPEVLPDVWKQQTGQQGRMFRNLITGVGKVEQGFANLPSDIERYVEHLGLKSEDKFSPKLQPFPRQERNYLGEWFGPKDKQPGDVFFQNVPSALLFYNPAASAAKLAGKGIGTAANVLTGERKYAALAKKLGVSEKEAELISAEAEQQKAIQAHEQTLAPHEEAESKLSSAQEAFDLAKEQKNLARNVATEETGAASPYGMEHTIRESNKKLNELDQNITALSHQMENVPPAEKAPLSDISHIENLHAAKKQVSEAENHISHAEEQKSYALSQLNREDTNIAHHLNEGADYKTRVSREMNHEIESINNYWSNQYRGLMDNLRNNEFHLTNSDRLPRIETAITQARELYGNDPTGEFAQLIRRAPNVQDTNAADFLTNYKEFRDYRYNLLRQSQNEPSAVRRDELIRAYRDSQPIDRIINETLQEGLGEHAPEYARINHGYREQVFPLRENNVSHNIQEGKPLSSDIAHQLSGDQIGQSLLREIANRNPEIRRNILGQHYKGDINNLHNADETVREYLNNSPELNQLIQNRERANQMVSRSDENVASAISRHEQAKALEEKASIKSEEEKKQSLLNFKENAKKNKEIEKTKGKLQSDLVENHDEVKKLKEKIPLLEKNKKQLIAKEKEELIKQKELREADKNKKLTLKQKVDTENKVKEITKKIEKIKEEQEKLQKQINETHFGIKFLTRTGFKLIKRLGSKF